MSKEDTGATIRCIPFKEENLGDKCPMCGGKVEKWFTLQKPIDYNSINKRSSLD